MAKTQSIESLTDDELWAALQELQAERTAIGDRQDEIRAVINKRAADARASEILDGLTPDQRNVLIEAAVAQAGAGAAAPGEVV